MTATLITGCSTGIGLATAIHLAGRGHSVYASVRDLATSEGLRGATEEAGVALTVLSLDVDSPESIRAGVERVVEEAGRVDVLVNNAGVGDLWAVEDTTETDLLQMFRTNVFGPIALIRAVLPGMRAAGSGTIVNVSSVSARIVSAFSGPYAATKCALEAITQAVAVEGAAHGIRCVAIEPGFTQTPMLEKALSSLPSTEGPYSTVAGFIRALYKDGTETGGNPIDVARTIEAAIESEETVIQHPVGAAAEWVINGRAAASDQDWVDLWTRTTEEEFGSRFQELFGDPP
ncbi:MAG: SDR family oxidoreductase [Gemmatimonadota bacterium]|nr:SDR family oxidoreductase [Acidimicrobiales bacterium]MEC7847453.1 SDR family oxidoreductase [Gemmatimonadota bacterium]